MRLLWTFVLAASSALGAPLAGNAQVDRIDEAAKRQDPTFVGCPWQELGRFPGFVPRAVAIGKDGALLLAADDVTDPSRSALVVRRQAAAGAAWETVDRYLPAGAVSTGARALHVDADGNVFVPNAYGLVPRAIVPTTGGRLLVAGLGVRGAGSDDYLWLERWQNARGRWRTFAYQLTPGVTSVAQDAAATRNGVAVLGVAYATGAAYLMLRESSDGGSRWQTALQVSGVSDPWSARLAVDGRSAAVAASVQGAALVLGCRR